MSKCKYEISRRDFLEGTSAVLAVASATPALKLPLPTDDVAEGGGLQPGVPTSSIRVTINGIEHHVEVEDRWTLVELLRDHLQLTGTKIGCDRGECGACTVLLDGKPVYSCSNLAVWADGRTVQTVEGLAQGEHLDPLQQAFIEYDGPQCGFCTSGQLMSAKGLLAHNPHPTPQEVRAGMTGNICRCSNYNHYVAAVVAASSGKYGASSKRGAGHTSSAASTEPVAAKSGGKKRKEPAAPVGSTGGVR